ncbi:hypothetical protein ABZ747_18050 [Kitasatospora cineracea]|uniref:hypothetical protein n=1 Tax=Kitasatospora cineracea TaxID=88074 RepID=UPI0033E8B4F4
MLRLIPARLWESTQRRLRHAEDILAAQAAGWQAPLPPVDGDLVDVLRYVDTAVRDEAVCRAADFAENSFDEHSVLGLTMPERWTGYPDGTAVHYLGADRWLHYHPGRTTLGTYRSRRWPEAEQICLLDSRSTLHHPLAVAGLADLLEKLDVGGIRYTRTRPGRTADAVALLG